MNGFTLKSKFFGFINKHKYLIFVGLVGIVFSLILYFGTFGYKEGNLEINGKIHSDFISHIHLIRSFSVSDNFPPEYPLYPGEPIKYHFLFYLIIGIIESVGVRIDIALNILSSIGLIGMLYGMYALANSITKNKPASILAIVLTLFNSSLSWVYFLNKNGANIPKLLSSQEFASFGPYDDQIVSSFWSLNIYSNQRHLAFAFGLLFAILLLLNSKNFKLKLTAIVLTAIMAWLHKAMLLIILGFLILKVIQNIAEIKKYVVLIILFGLSILPAMLFMLSSSDSSFLNYLPGFIINSTSWNEFGGLSNPIFRFIIYWYMNLGLLPIFGLGGWFALNKFKKTFNLEKMLGNNSIWFVLAIGVFVVSNIFTFSTDPATNHKLINFVVFIFNIYASYTLVWLFQTRRISRIIVGICGFLLILGGIVDLPPIVNDYKINIPDISADPTSTWITNNSNAKDTFLVLSYDNNYLRVTGRSVFMGWPYFAWSLGYNTYGRDKIIREFMNSTDTSSMCSIAGENSIDYLVTDQNSPEFLETEVPFEFLNSNLYLDYQYNNIAIYNFNSTCSYE